MRSVHVPGQTLEGNQAGKDDLSKCNGGCPDVQGHEADARGCVCALFTFYNDHGAGVADGVATIQR